ncbi:MAG: NADH:flavin oxidoreductase, partial [Thermodesulfobacteriota bacterium]
MKYAFEPTEILSLRLPNRFVRSATWEGLADQEGRVTDGLIRMLSALASGGLGLIITGFAFVSAGGRALPHQTGVHRDDLAPDLARLAGAVREAGG